MYNSYSSCEVSSLYNFNPHFKVQAKSITNFCGKIQSYLDFTDLIIGYFALAKEWGICCEVTINSVLV